VAVDVSTWPGADVEAVVVEARRYARALQKTRPEEANEVLLRGAALHADIARLIPQDTVRRSASQQRIYVVEDGRQQGTRFVSIHWGLGRSLLDAVAPAPGAHPDVRLWYHATSADLLRLRSLAEAVVHLPRARQLFPGDPVLLFWSGVLHERLSSASLQAAARSLLSANYGETSVASARGELERAERFLRETLIAEPDHLQARLRHGRVLGQLGRHAQAADELRAAIGRGLTSEFLYLAQLFLGAEEEALGNLGEARVRFQHAASLYPRAQSPRLALSQLSRLAGDRAGAQRELRFLSELPDNERQREDPWWTYYDAR
jgi:tetratricopeptide (TPR) repeat protein